VRYGEIDLKEWWGIYDADIEILTRTIYGVK